MKYLGEGMGLDLMGGSMLACGLFVCIEFIRMMMNVNVIRYEDGT